VNTEIHLTENKKQTGQTLTSINDRTVLGTGGCGFIGTDFVHHHYENYDCDIVNLDALTYAGDRTNHAYLSQETRYRFLEADVYDREQLRRIMGDCDVVVHLAAESHVDHSIENPDMLVRTNVLGTSVLLNCALEASVKRFLYMSTDEVYGPRAEGEFDEEDKLNPTSPYAASKAGADHLVKSFYRTYVFPTLTVRGTNSYVHLSAPR
jgi:dTDP-glucose 4,6-dehydratase